MIRGLWHRETIALLMIAAVLPVAVLLLATEGWTAAIRLGVSLLVLGFWQAVFLVLRAQPPTGIGIVTAVAVGVLAPGDLALWQVVLALTFGAVVGEQVFGGWGRNVLNTAVVTLGFLYFAFPETLHEAADADIALAVLPGALLLVVFGIASLRVLAGAVAGLLAGTVLLGGDIAVLALQGSLVFGLVFLVCDPVTSAATRPGRWLYGLLAGGLAALFGWAGTGIGAPQAVVFAALLASLFAPLIDHAVIAATNALRSRRHG